MHRAFQYDVTIRKIICFTADFEYYFSCQKKATDKQDTRPQNIIEVTFPHNENLSPLSATPLTDCASWSQLPHSLGSCDCFPRPGSSEPYGSSPFPLLIQLSKSLTSASLLDSNATRQAWPTELHLSGRWRPHGYDHGIGFQPGDPVEILFKKSDIYFGPSSLSYALLSRSI